MRLHGASIVGIWPRSRWLTQTKDGGADAPLEERGDCCSASIASILGVALEEIRNHHESDWWEVLQEAVGRFGYCIAILDPRFHCYSYWLAAVPSLNLAPGANGKVPYHCIVCRGDEVVHDPSRNKKYTTEKLHEAMDADAIADAWVLVPRDPAKMIRA